MRGKPDKKERLVSDEGITPAGAGKTLNDEYIITLQLGSPPQVRGKLFSVRLVAFPYGITPAGAGKTNYIPFTATDAEDHPRRCGENRM